MWRKLIYKLDKAEILELLIVVLKSYKKLVNPEKIYLGNSNLMYALSAKIFYYPLLYQTQPIEDISVNLKPYYKTLYARLILILRGRVEGFHSRGPHH